MTGKNIPWNALIEEAELDALAWKTMSRVKDNETLPTGGVYRRMMAMLKTRADELSANPNEPMVAVHDWLALALFDKDRSAFLQRCQQADADNDPVYRQAEHWLRQFIDAEGGASASV